MVTDYNDYEIECSCGYVLLVPRSRVGQNVECVTCGDDVFVDPDRVRPAKHVDNPGPAPPVTAEGSAVPNPFQAASDSPAGDWADEAEPAEPAQPQLPTVQRPAARSPFEEPDAGEPEDTPNDALPPPPMERAGELQANRFYDDVVAGTERFKPVSAEPEEIESTGECARCGRPFRGDWDRLETKKGVICYNCSNLATEGAPERLAHQEARKRTAPVERPDDALEVNHPARFWLFDPESQGFRIMLWVLAFGTIGFALLLPYFEPADIASSTSSSSDGASGSRVLPENPAWWMWALFYIHRYGAATGATFLAIFATLSVTGRLPHERFYLNAIAIGWATFVVSIIAVAGALIIAAAVFMLGEFAVFVSMMVVPVAVLIMISVLMNLLDFRIRDFVILLLLGGMANKLAYSAVDLIVGGIFNLLT